MKSPISDPHMVVEQPDIMDCKWHCCDEAPMVLEGIKFRNRKNMLRRLPVSTLEKPLPARVDGYADHTSGGILRFSTDSEFVYISARVRVLNNSADIMTYARIGFDIYRIIDGHYHFAGISRMNFDEIDYPVHQFKVPLLFEPNQTGEIREYEINFPLYAQVESFALGLGHGARIVEPSPRMASAPIVWYGTSVTQGCCASRPGLGLSNRLSRTLNREVINLGFAGSGRGEPEVAEAIAQISNPACYILSYDGNVSVEQSEKTLPVFVDILRSYHPEVAILTKSLHRMPGEIYSSSPERIRRNAIHVANLNRRRKLGDNKIFFLDGFALYNSDLCDCYVDSCHPNDCGMTQYIKYLSNEMQSILYK